MQGVHLEISPEGPIDIIALGIERHEIHQDDNGASGNLPTAYAQREILLQCGTAPISQQLLVFYEKGIILALPEVWSDKNDTIGHRILQSFRTCRKNGINTAHFITYFPTGLKNVIGKEFLLPHLPKRVYLISLLKSGAKVHFFSVPTNLLCAKIVPMAWNLDL